MSRAAVLALALCACGDNLPDPGTAHSGARLKLAWYEYDDGTRQLETGWYHDAQLEMRCTPTAWSDGKRYCAPATDEAVYVSDTCTRALGRTPVGAEPAPYFATRFVLKGEPLPSRVFERGAEASAPITVYQKLPNGCFATELGEGFTYYELGAEITDLVQLHRSKPRGDGWLAIVDEISDDGLRVPSVYFDRNLGVECTPVDRANADTVECVPNDAAIASYFQEVGCLEPELALLGGVVPATAKQYSELTRCWSYYDVGDEVTAPPLYEAVGGTCTSASPPQGAHFYVMAGPHQSPSVRRERETTTRRLARIDRVRDGLRVPDPLLYDRELGIECRPDDQLRCAPAADAAIEAFFADSGCTTPLDLALVPTGECDAPSQFARKGEVYFPLVAPYTKTIYWLSTGDTCGIYGPPSSFVAWTIGPALDPATLASATLTFDR